MPDIFLNRETPVDCPVFLLAFERKTMKYFVALTLALCLSLFTAYAKDGAHRPLPDSLVVHASNTLAIARIDEAISIDVRVDPEGGSDF